MDDLSVVLQAASKDKDMKNNNLFRWNKKLNIT